MMEKTFSKDTYVPKIVFDPSRAWQQGMNTLIEAIRPTLGPCPRTVAVDRGLRGKAPELLDNAGVIARRVYALHSRTEDAGAMILRQALCSLHQDVGDGVATAAVIFGVIYNQGLRYITAGGDSMRLRHYLHDGSRLVLESLDTQTFHPEANLSQVAESICHDRELADHLGEIYHIMGPYGRVEVRASRRHETHHEYVEGTYWDVGLFASSDPTLQTTRLTNPAMLVTDFQLEDPGELVPVLKAAVEAGERSMVIMAKSIADRVHALFKTLKDREFHILPVKTIDHMRDLAILTGADSLVEATGTRFASFSIDQLGHAREAWANRDQFGIVSGRGDARQLRQHVAALRQRDSDSETEKRIGQLLGGTAVLWVGGLTQQDIDQRKELASRTARVVRAALCSGVVVGGGIALLNARSALSKLSSVHPDAHAAHNILLAALAAPFRTIVDNAGYSDSAALARIERGKPGYGFNAVTGKVEDMFEAGILDSAAVQKAAVRTAVTSAALALSIDVLVQHRTPEKVIEP